MRIQTELRYSITPIHKQHSAISDSACGGKENYHGWLAFALAPDFVIVGVRLHRKFRHSHGAALAQK